MTETVTLYAKGNGAKIVRTYDDADRLLSIEHRDASDNALLFIEYAWNLDNTVATRTETDYTGQPTLTTVVTFGYDARQRLISETRVVNQTTTVYDLAYTYDQLGNRLTKIDSAPDPQRKTEYYYDTDPDNRDPNYPTNNNRLLWYVESADDGQEGWNLARTVRYTYYATGDVSNITIKDEGEGEQYDVYHDLALYYTSSGSLWRALWDQWTLDGGQVSGYTRTAAREFYYDTPMQRYLARDVDPDTWAPLGQEPWRWAEYERGEAHDDFTLTPGDEPVEQTRYLAEFGIHAQATLGEEGATRYLHGDLVQSTILTTDESGTAASAVAYTAFGEPIGDPEALATRYQYAGGWGYETGMLSLAGANPILPPIGLLHVGARWYGPAIGRFVQRDPIGLGAGLNCYGYSGSCPASRVDPSGLISIDEVPGGTYVGADISDAGGVVTGAGSGVFLWGLARRSPHCMIVGSAVAAVGGVIWGVGSGVSLIERHLTGPWGSPPKPRPLEPSRPLTPEELDRLLRKLGGLHGIRAH